MADAGGERSDSTGRRGQGRGGATSCAPRFVNRIPSMVGGRTLAVVMQAERAARARAKMAGHASNRYGRPHGALAARRPPTPGATAGTTNVGSAVAASNEKGDGMKKRLTVGSLETVSLEEALAYLDGANGDELGAAFTLAHDRNRLDGSNAAPDDAEVHHALFLLRRARGLDAPSFDLMRVQLRRHVAA
jgi:hypothetical protein